jgi:hypothetical protein
MELDSILDGHKKLIRKLRHLWPSLVNPRNFLIPETIEEHKQFGIFAPRIKIEPCGECFFNEKSKLYFREFSDTIYRIPQIANSVSYNLVYQTAKSFIEKAVSDRVNHSTKADSERDIQNLIQSLIDSRAPFHFYRVVDGIKLEGIESLMIGDVELFVCTEAKEKELQVYRDTNNERGWFDEYIIPFFRKTYLNRVCIRTVAIGDKAKAEQIAVRKIKESLNVLRFIICMLRPETIYDNRLKINLHAEAYDVSESTMDVNLADNLISLSFGKTRKPFDTLPIDVPLLENLKQHYFFSDLLGMLTNNNRTELDENILTSIYWIGEAQNDFLSESAFVKCWTALETIFSLDEDRVTKTLGRGIPILLAFGGYRFIKLDEIEEVQKKVERLYRKRSKVVHRGLYESVSPMELVDVCKYATWSVLTCLGLRTKGYKELEQIRIETERLFQASMSHVKYFRKPERGGNVPTKDRDEGQISKNDEKGSIR